LVLVVEALIALLILVGSFFLLVGSLGLAKLPDLMRRLHGPTKATTLGIGTVLIASMTYFSVLERDLSVHELLIALFLFLTAPVSAQMIAKAFILSQRAVADAALPPTGRPVGWATLDPAPADREAEEARLEAEARVERGGIP
jgi:multicomponent K+:H+ antiporter subunit G